ncbi:MAG: LPXTG cell wall anchor domain-containing protein [Bryobacteraceae bacterium]|jgi:LPXTG-motif cell wall-anchored protein
MTRFVVAMASVGLLGVALSSSARADEWNKKTVMTVSEPIQVPNKVLPAGTYVIKLLDSPSDRHIVQIFDASETHLQTTILAIPNYRIQPTGKTVFTFWETPPGQPKALRAWFYPGDNFGQEFAYPKSAAVQIAAVAHQPVPTTETTQAAELPQAEVTQTQPEPQEVAQATPPPAPVAEPAPAPEPAPVPAPQELPKTGSPYPLIGLAGLLSLGLFALVRAFRLS